MAIVLMATLFLSPGLRHTHEGGDEDHSHPHPQTHSHRHAHSHKHSHSHSDDVHGHTHDAHSHSHAHHQHGGEVTAAQSHVHISFLWFEFTLPDALGSGEKTVAVNAEDHGPADTATDSSTVMTVTSPFTMAQLIQLMLLIPAPLPERTTIPDSNVVRCLAPASLLTRMSHTAGTFGAAWFFFGSLR